MNPWRDAEEILSLVKDDANWTSELFERCRNNTLVSPCIFNQIRKVLSADQYQRFDDAYCLHGRPEQKKLIDMIRRERRKEQRKSKEMELLKKRKQLLKQKLQKLTNN